MRSPIFFLSLCLWFETHKHESCSEKTFDEKSYTSKQSCDVRFLGVSVSAKHFWNSSERHHFLSFWLLLLSHFQVRMSSQLFHHNACLCFISQSIFKSPTWTVLCSTRNWNMWNLGVFQDWFGVGRRSLLCHLFFAAFPSDVQFFILLVWNAHYNSHFVHSIGILGPRSCSLTTKYSK